MKRDDFGVRIDEIRELATKYSKPDLARMVQMGMLEPQKALMAGMMIDRIAKSAMEPPQSTVAQDVLGQRPTAAQGQFPPGIMAAPGAPAPSAGVAALPSGITEMAGGGIVAFADGGAPQPTYLPDNLDFAKGQVPVYQAKAPEKVDLAKAGQMRQEAEKQAGVSPTFFEDLRKDVLADKEDFAKQKNEAQGMALIQLGFGIAAAREGQEFQAANAAVQQAVSSYGSALKEIKAAEKEMKKSLRDVSVAEQAYKRSNAEKDLARVQAAEDKLQAHEQNYIKALNDGVARKIDLFKDQRQRETQIETAKIGAGATLGAARIHAGAPGAEQKLLETIHAEEVARNPENPPTMAETYERMKTNTGKAEARAKYALALEKEWNDMGVMQGKFMEDNPTIKSGDDYIRAKMKVFDEYYGKPGAAGRSSALPMPPKQSDLRVGAIYETARGPARWNGAAFEPVPVK